MWLLLGVNLLGIRRCVVTGSRDRTIKLWSVREEGGLVTQPLVSRLKVLLLMSTISLAAL